MCWGRNSRLDNIQAAILSYKLQDYENVITRRREIDSMYETQLSGLEELSLPPSPDSDPNHFDVFQNYEIEAERRDQLKLFLNENGIGSLIQWNGQPVHSITSLGFSGSGLPYTENMYEKCLMIPMNTSLKNDEINYICEIITKFYS